MSLRTASPKQRYHPNAYEFIFSALRFMQEKIGPVELLDPEDKESHISGPELLDGIRELALNRFGLLARTVLKQWGITTTDDFGHMIFEMIENGQMRKTDSDQLEDFFNVYQFDAAFDHNYKIDLSNVFAKEDEPTESNEEQFLDDDFDFDDLTGLC